MARPAPARARASDLENRLFERPVIEVPTITMASDFDGAAPDGIGHNVPQEAPQAFADAIIEVDGY